jgi:adenine-specific DNA-methyltransferase
VALEQSDAFSVEVLPKLSDGADGRWRWGPSTVQTRLVDLTARQVGPEERWDVFQKDYAENDSGAKRIRPKTVWIGSEFSNESGTLEVKRLLGKGVFDTAKPVGLLTYLCEQALQKGDTVLDFFAGSGTTAHAVIDLNKRDGGNRKYVLVQLPELTVREDYPTIADICKDRVRRVIKKLNDEDAGKLALDGDNKPDRGFRVFKLAESNFKSWNADLPQGDVAALEEQLAMHIDHLIADRTAEDRLYELLLKSGFPLTTHVETLTLDGKTVHSVQDGAMLICLDKDLTFDAIKAMADMKPERVVCLDEGFAGNDQLKTNAVQTMKGKNIVFRTV